MEHPIQNDASSVLPQPPPELMAVIAAAVSATFGKRAQIVGVSNTSSTDMMVFWALEGRRMIFSSHKLR